MFVDYHTVATPKHLRIWQLPTFFRRARSPMSAVESLPIPPRRCTTGIAGCVARRMRTATMRFADSADAYGYDAICRLGASSASASASARARHTADSRRQARRYVGGGVRQACRQDVRRGLVRLRRTRQMRLSALQAGSSAGLSDRRRALRQGGGGGLRENCRTLVYYAFWRAKFFYKRRVRRVKEMLRIWVF